MDSQSPRKVPASPGKGTAILAALVIMTLFAAGIGKEMGFIENDTAKRISGVVFGLLVILFGNILPKLVSPLGSDAEAAGRSRAADRIAGLVLVLTGLAVVAIWLAVPADSAMLASAMAGLGGLFISLMLWTFQAAPRLAGFRGPEALEHPASIRRLTVLFLLHAVFWVFLIFLADTLWGDASAKWIAIAFTLLNGVIALPLIIGTLRTRRARPEK